MIEFGKEPLGHPWHGPCSGSIVTLPNGQTKSHVQPSGGDVHLFQIPGAPGGTQTPEDTAAGRQWLDYALLSGRTMHLYGKALGEGKWLYLDPAGARWLVSTTLHDKTVQELEGQSITVTLDRFGEFLSPPERHEYTVAVPNLGQDGPPVNGLVLSPHDRLLKSQITARRFGIHPQGEKATFILAAVAGGLIRRTQWQDRPVGWLELSITGNGEAAAISLVVLKNRAETIGTMSFSGGFENAYLYRVTAVTFEYVEYGGVSVLVSSSSVTTPMVSSSPGLEDFNVAGNVQTTIAYALQSAGAPVAMRVGSKSASIESIIAVGYTQAGVLTYTTARYTHSANRIDTQTLVVDSELNNAWTVEGAQTSAVPLVWHTDQATSHSYSLAIDVLVDGVTVQSFDSGSCVANLVGSHPSGIHSGANITGSTSFAEDASDKIIEKDVPSAALVGGEPMWRLYSLYNIEVSIDVDYSSSNTSNTLSHTFAVCNYSNAVHGVNKVRRWALSGSFTGLHTIGEVEVSAAAAYASRHPVTGEVVTGMSQVCWV